MSVTPSSSTREILAQMPDITVVYTRDDSILRGRRARWFPRLRTIYINGDLLKMVARCSLMHELAHVILDHQGSCNHTFYDQRIELEADRFAARLLLPDLDELAIELATTSHHGHAARNLRVTLDMLEVRLNSLTTHEHRYLSKRVWSVHDGVGA